jgi:hypothetical protein
MAALTFSFSMEIRADQKLESFDKKEPACSIHIDQAGLRNQFACVGSPCSQSNSALYFTGAS